MRGPAVFRRAWTFLGSAVVLDVVNHSMARYPSRGPAVAWLCVDLVLFVAVARGSRVAWRLLGASMAFGATLFLLAAIGDPSQSPRGLLFAAQLLLLLSPAVRAGIKRRQVETRPGWAR
jgi:hypothetical protein